jgi:hypothetical protein
VLEPASEVNCPALSVLSVNSAGFENTDSRRDNACPKPQGVGSPSALEKPQESSYLADGTVITARDPASIAAPLAFVSP